MSENSQHITNIVGFLIVFIMVLVFIYPIAVFLACELLDRINNFKNPKPHLSPETIKVINQGLEELSNVCFFVRERDVVKQAQEEFKAQYGEGK